MQATTLTRAGTRMLLADVAVALPALCKVLLRTVATGVCYSDLHIVDGDLTYTLPVILRDETAGADVAAARSGHQVRELAARTGVAGSRGR